MCIRDRREDVATKIKYASKYATIANYWKKWIGESQGLQQTYAVNKKLDYEAPFQKRLPQNSPYKTCLLYTSDAADDQHCVDLGGRRIIKKKSNSLLNDVN